MTLKIEDCRIAVEAYYGLYKHDLLGVSRRWRVSHPRHVAMALAFKLTGKSSTQIALYFSKKDHASTFNAAEAVMDCDKRRADYEQVRLSLAVYAAQMARFEDRASGEAA